MSESPWWLAAAGAIVAGLVAAIGKLWAANITLRREADERSERDQREAAARSERLEIDHKRDLRRVIWGPTNPPKK